MFFRAKEKCSETDRAHILKREMNIILGPNPTFAAVMGRMEFGLIFFV